MITRTDHPAVIKSIKDLIDLEAKQTGCFAGKGKVRTLETLRKDQSVIDVFARLGTTEAVI